MSMYKLFKNKDRVVFFGDSITHNNYWIEFIDQYFKKHYPKLDVKFFNSGIAGARLATGFKYYDNDFSYWNGNVVVLMYGMNDSDRFYLADNNTKGLNDAFELYKKNLKKMHDTLIQDGYRVIICTPTPYDETNESSEPFYVGCSKLIEKYAAYVRQFAKENDVELIDFNAYMTPLVKSVKNIIKPDHTHPTSEVGNYYMAKCFLSYFGEELDFDCIDGNHIKHNEIVQLIRDYFAFDFLCIPENIAESDKRKFAENYSFESPGYDEYFAFLKTRYLSVDNIDLLREKIK